MIFRAVLMTAHYRKVTAAINNSLVSKHEVFDYYKIELPQEAADQPKQEKEEL